MTRRDALLATQIRLRSWTTTASSALPYRWWFLAGSAGIAALAFGGTSPTTIFILALLLLLSAATDLWQFLLTGTLGALVLATTGRRGVPIELEQPFLLRFVLITGLVALLLLRHPPSFAGRHVARTQTLILCFLAWAGLSAALSEFLTVAAQAVLAAGMTIAIPAIAVRGRWRDRVFLLGDLFVIHRVLWLLAAITLALAAASGFSSRAMGIHDSANTVGYLSALGFGLGLGLRLRLSPMLGWMTLLTFVLAAMASGSRGAIVGIALSQGYLLLRLRHRMRRRVATVLGSLLFIFAVVLSTPSDGRLDLAATYIRTFEGEELNLAGRQSRWQDLTTLIAVRPVLGHGLGASQDALGITQRQGLTSSPGAHNSYLTVAAETGTVGAFLLFGTVALQLRRRAPLDVDGENAAAWLACSGLVVAGLGHMIGESFILGVGSPFPLIFWTGVVVLSAVGR